jgi:hypothetical protein
MKAEAQTKTSTVSKTPRPATAWATHVKEYRVKFGGSFKDALKAAGATYTKTPRQRKLKTEHKPNPWMEHIKLYKAANPTWKADMSYKKVLEECKITYAATK